MTSPKRTKSMCPGFLKGQAPESWCCVDCDRNTAPGCLGRVDLERAMRAAYSALGKGDGVRQTITTDSEVYSVRDAVWKRAGVEPWGGCLCVECLEKRIGRQLTPKDFPRNAPLNRTPGSGGC